MKKKSSFFGLPTATYTRSKDDNIRDRLSKKSTCLCRFDDSPNVQTQQEFEKRDGNDPIRIWYMAAIRWLEWFWAEAAGF